MTQNYKIIFTGLDFAGKTSILNVLEGTYSGLDGIKPTLGTEKSDWNIMGMNVINWDLGGQKRYRDEYLQNKRNILTSTDLIIFILDIQDSKRFEEAVDYYNDLLFTFNQLSIKCPVILCLHKADPDFFDSTAILKATDLFSACSKKHDVKMKSFNTSIFNQKSLIEMFSSAISELIELAIVNRILTEFRKETKDFGTIGVVLFDQNFFVLGASFPDDITKNTCYNTINAFTTLIRDLKDKYNDKNSIELTVPVKETTTYKFSLLKIMELRHPSYLLLMGTLDLNLGNNYSTFQPKYVTQILNSFP